MMKITISKVMLIVGAFISINAIANVKTSSLSITKPMLVKSLPTECEKMFKLADKFISDADRQPGTHTQVTQMKSRLSSTRQQLSKMDSALQIRSCEKGLSALNTLQQSF